MGSFSIRESLAGVAIAALLTNSATAAPSPLMGRACLANIVSDLSCADSSIMTRCISIERVDAELLATCLEAAGCNEDEAENALWITEKCQTTSASGNSTQPDLEGELRRRFHARRNNKRQDSTTTSEESTTATATSTSSATSETSTSTSTSTSSSASSTTSATSTSTSSTTSTSTTSSASATSTSTSSYADLDIGLSSAIVGSVMGIAAALAFGGVFICAWREGAAKRKAKREAAQKEALLSNIG